MQIFYESNGEKIGPVAIESITPNQILQTTLVWHEGLNDWIEANKVPELAPILSKNPPALPFEKKNERIDTTYQRTEEPFFIAGVIVLFSVILILLYKTTYVPEDYKFWIAIVGMLMKLVAMKYAYELANELNREKIGWALLVFFIPAIGLTILGFQPKLLMKSGTTWQKEIDKLKDRNT